MVDAAHRFLSRCVDTSNQPEGCVCCQPGDACSPVDGVHHGGFGNGILASGSQRDFHIPHFRRIVDMCMETDV